MRKGTVVGLVALGLSAGCSADAPASSPVSAATVSSGPTRPATSAPPRGTPATASASAAPLKPTPRPALSCGARLAAAMTPAQRAGQLLMVGLRPGVSSSTFAAQLRHEAIGSVIYVGGWHHGAAATATVSARLRAGAGRQLLIAADQEGGAVQQLRGPGFSTIPSASAQGTTGAAAEARNVQRWVRELGHAGVTVDLAPVADTVPARLGPANAPIGRYHRDFTRGDSNGTARSVTAFVRGALAGGVAPTLKHFPGLGRVTGNTDTTSVGITDDVTSATDPYLRPFAAGIAAGAPLVMVSSAWYPRLDPDHQAMFSAKVVTGLLRRRLGFTGVVVTDDVGAARSVAQVPVGRRATTFVGAGGDIVLTTEPSQAPTMLNALLARSAASPSFATLVDASAARVLNLKARLGLVRCR